jgi:DNA-directed RNA polymerase sigma subunit (sigma70/sigma32)
MLVDLKESYDEKLVDEVWEILKERGMRPKLLQILYDFWIKGQTYQEIGERFGVTPERIRQLHAKGAFRLLHPHYRRPIVALLKEHGVFREKKKEGEA